MFRCRPIAAVVLLAVLLPGCAQRGAIVFDATAGEVGSVHEIMVATTRAPALGTDANTRVRAEELTFSRFDISVPPNRRQGTVTVPSAASPDPARQFLVVSAEAFSGERDFTAAVNAAVAQRPPGHRDAIVFVHGFNTNLAEGIYRHAQMRHDFRTPGIAMHYAWPSAATVSAYAFDRESALFARDGLEQLLDALARSNVSNIIVVGHSMGAQVVMETVRQMAIRKAPAFFRKLEAVVLVSPISTSTCSARSSGLSDRLPRPCMSSSPGATGR